uniref:FHOD1 N-terminal GTPase-binding domain-containing protein n=1 Tax=Oryzias latipes TaxID=8090 RepID=A0A3P9MF58_ORYLA
MATFICRVQFLDDTDPFNSTNFPEPTRPPLYTFREDIPLINQIAGVHRQLKAPQKVCTHVCTHAWLCSCCFACFHEHIVENYHGKEVV